MSRKTVNENNSTGKKVIKSEEKIYSLPELLKVLETRKGEKVAFTNGCFDILHAGHVMYLQKSAECGDILIVGVNTDDSIRRLKGPTRPVNELNDRLMVLGGLQCIDYLVAFGEDTPENLLEAIRPDVMIKGSDYEGKFLPGADFVKSYGGEVKLIPILENHSTTGIINKMGNK